MKHFIALGLIASGSLFTSGETAQGQAFVNLDFQAANLSNEFSESGVFPGWSFAPPVGASFLQPHISSLPQRHLVDTAGDFSLVMAAGEVPTNPEWTAFEPSDITVLQTGLVPAATKSLKLHATSPDPYFQFATTGELAWQLSLDGTPISMTDLGGGLWGANIPSFSNTVATLDITMNQDYYLSGAPLDWPWGQFDDIAFSTQSIPEPASLGLAVVALGIAARSKRLR
ncbi:MAG: hypothetical protein JNL18_24405 [Planctomycetaceae bacterium]|nr:hypothetical protein [Planctomycetaceae bacterium]